MPIPTQLAGSRPIPRSRGVQSDYRVSQLPTVQASTWNNIAQSAQEGLGMFNDMVQRDKLRETVGFENEAKRDLMNLLYGNEETQGLYSQNGENAVEIDRQFESGFNAIREKYLSRVKDPELHAKFSQTLDNMYTSNYGSIKQYQMKERQAASSLMMTSGIALSNDRIGLEFNNDNTFAEELTNIRQSALARGKIDGLTGDPLNALVKSEVSKGYLQRFNALTAQDDIGAQEKAFELYLDAQASDDLTFDTKIAMQERLEKLKPQIMAKKAYGALQGPAVGDDGIIEFVMNDLEGGDKIVPDGKGRARWGINEYWNPEVDLDSMTESDAKDVYKNKYMSRIDKFKNLSPEARMVAFDAAVNHRAGFAEEIIEKSGGNVDRMMNLRLNEYQRLAKADPEQYGGHLKGWKNRLKKLYEKVGSGIETKQTEITPEMAKQARMMLPMDAQDTFDTLIENHNNQVNLVKQQRTNATANVAADALSQGMAYSQLPAEVQSDLENMGIANMAQKYKGHTDQNTAAYLYSLAPEQLAETDLTAPSIRFGLSAQDYAMWKDKQAKTSDSSYSYTDKQKTSLVKKAFDEMNISYSSNNGKGRYARFNQLLDASIGQFTINNNGRYPSQPELQKMVDDLFIEIDFKPSKVPSLLPNPFLWEEQGWGGTNRVFDAQLDDIPNHMQERIAGMLRQQGMPVNDATMVQAYVDYLSRTGESTPKRIERFDERLTD